jgi:cobalt-zinc-cadmium efflux system outer membrane protein
MFPSGFTSRRVTLGHCLNGRRFTKALLPLTLLSTACAAQDAGYADTRRSLEQFRLEARWRAVDEKAHPEENTRLLLAKELDADTAVRVAMLNNADVQTAFEELGVARAALVTALRLPNPVVEGGIAFHKPSPDYEFGALLALNDLLFLSTRAGAAEAQLDAAKLSVVGNILDLALDVRVAYYRYVAARQIVDLRRHVLLAARSSYESAEELHRAGNTTDLDFHNQRALYEDQRLLEAQAESELTRERARLEALMGLAGTGAKWDTVALLPNADTASSLPADAEHRALEKSLDLEIARRRFTAAAKRANLARAEGLLPEVRAGVTVEKEYDEPNWGVGPKFQVALPLLYQGGGEVARAQSDMRRERSAYTSAAQQIRAAVQEVGARLETARSSVAFYRDVQLPLREQIVNETQLQFNAMTSGVFQLLQAKRDQIEAGRAYVETLRDYWITRSEADQLLTGRLVHVRETTVPAAQAESRTW